MVTALTACWLTSAGTRESNTSPSLAYAHSFLVHFSGHVVLLFQRIIRKIQGDHESDLVVEEIILKMGGRTIGSKLLIDRKYFTHIKLKRTLQDQRKSY